MRDTSHSISRPFDWLSYPLLVFAASRVLIFVFTASAPLFGGKLGTPAGLSQAFVARHPLWAGFGHGDLARYLGIASSGYKTVADASIFPVVPFLGKILAITRGSPEMGLILLSLVACAAGFVGIHRLFEHLHGREAGRWGVALLAAFPLAYHLSDGGSLAWVLAFSAWGVFMVVRGSNLAAGVLLSLAALSHPVGIFAAVAAGCLSVSGESSVRPFRKWCAVLSPAVVLAGWLGYLRVQLRADATVLWSALSVAGDDGGQAWAVLLAVLAGLAVVGLVLAARLPGRRALAVAGLVQLAFVLRSSSPAAAQGLMLCWPAWLGIAGLLGERPTLRAPLVAMLGAQQGLLLYGFSRFLRLT